MSFDDHSPIYRQLAGQIRAEILAGQLADDDQVMSTNAYAAYHRINPATVAKAFQALVDDGLLYKKRGLGMFVTPGAAERLLNERRARFAEEHVAPLLAEAGRLGIDVGELVDQIRRTASTGPTTKGLARR